jgi:Zn-dependent protease/predicted transcriptional regulator
MDGSWKLGRVAGIEVSIHSSWLIGFALFTWVLAQGLFAANYPGWAPVLYWLAGAGSALAIFASVLVHELGHSLMARRRGQEVHGITLLIIGGVSDLKAEPRTPGDEFVVAIVGPLTSFAIGALALAAGQLVPAGDGPVGAVLSYLGAVNIILGAFNLLPGFPLDGGRVLRSIVWRATGDLRRATELASYVGQGMALLLVLWGLGRLLNGEVFGGLWVIFLGWFLNGAAEATRLQQGLAEEFAGVLVADVLDPVPPLVGPDISVEEFVFEHVLRRGQRAVLVTMGDVLRGIVSVTDVKRVAQPHWTTTTLGQIMTPVPLKTVEPETDLNTALELLVRGSLNQLPVLSEGRVVGLLSRADVLRYLQLRQELHLRAVPGEPATSPVPR